MPHVNKNKYMNSMVSWSNILISHDVQIRCILKSKLTMSLDFPYIGLSQKLRLIGGQLQSPAEYTANCGNIHSSFIIGIIISEPCIIIIVLFFLSGKADIG